MNEDKKRHTVWLTPDAWNQVETSYTKDNCTTKNEYIEKAIRFYTGYLNTQNAASYLPRVLADVLEGKLGGLLQGRASSSATALTAEGIPYHQESGHSGGGKSAAGCVHLRGCGDER